MLFSKDLKTSNVHSYHKLKRTKIDGYYTCNACNQTGGPGKIYWCKYCNFCFHSACATVPKMFPAQDYFNEHPYILTLTKNQGNMGDLYCQCCGQSITGYFLGNFERRRFFHPLCVNIPSQLKMHRDTLNIYKGRTDNCHACGHSLSGNWAYGNQHKQYFVHVRCITNWYMELDIKWNRKKKNKIKTLISAVGILGTAVNAVLFITGNPTIGQFLTN